MLRGAAMQRLEAALLKAGGAAAAAAAAAPARVLVRCAAGAEALVGREAQALAPDDVAAVEPRTGTVSVAFHEGCDPQAYLRYMLQSRLANRVLVPLCSVPRRGKLRDACLAQRWGRYLPLSSAMELPLVRVTLDPSAGPLEQTRDQVQATVLGALAVHRKAAVERGGDTPRELQAAREEVAREEAEDGSQDESHDEFAGRTAADEAAERAGAGAGASSSGAGGSGAGASARPAAGASAAAPTPLRAPTVHVDFFNDECTLSVDAGGVLGIRRSKCRRDRRRLTVPAQRAPGGEYDAEVFEALREAPVRLLDSHCALAVVRSRLLRELGAVDDRLVLWDPFCNNFAICLEAMGIVLGLPPNRRESKFPFMHFPALDWVAYRNLRRSIEFARHPQWARLRVVGSDPTAHPAGGIAAENRANFLADARAEFGRREPDVLPALEERVVLAPEAADPADMALRIPAEDCIIVTAPPAGKAASAKKTKEKEFAKMLKERNWKAVYVITPENGKFRETSGLQWTVLDRWGASDALGGGPRMLFLQLERT